METTETVPGVNAEHNPVRRPSRELHSDDVKINQKPVIRTRADMEDEVVVSEGDVAGDYAEALKMAEDPVTIRIERGDSKVPASMVDCWVNGRGAEVLIQGRWVALGFLPTGIPLTTKRKYLEVLARSKRDNVNTKVTKSVDSEVNEIERYATQNSPFSVIEDRNPRGAEWLTRLLRMN